MSDKEDSDSDFKNNIFTSYREAESSLKRKSKNEAKPPAKRNKLSTANLEYQQTSPAPKNSTLEKSLGKTVIARNDTFPLMKSQQGKQDIDSDVETVKLNPEINCSDLDSCEDEKEGMDSARETSDELIKSYNNHSNKYLQEQKCSNTDNCNANNGKQRKQVSKYSLGGNMFEDGASGKQSRMPTDTLRDGSDSEVKNLRTSDMSYVKQSTSHNISPTRQKKTVHQKVIESAVSKKCTSVSRPTISSSDSEFEISTNKSIAFNEKPESFGKLASEFILKNPDYKEISFPEEVSLSQLDDDDEVFYIQMPQSFNAKWLKGSNISLSGKTKIKVEDKTFVINPVNDESPQPLFLFSDCLQRVEPSKSFIMQEIHGIRKKRPPSVSDKKNVPISSRIKLRHPVFGAHFSDKIDLEPSVHKRLEQAVSSVKKHKDKLLKKSSMKKTNVKNKMHMEDEKQEIIFEMLQAHNFDGVKRHKSSSYSKKQKRNEPQSKNNRDSTCEDTDSGIVDAKPEPLLPDLNKGKRYSFVNSTLNANLLHHPYFDSEISQINIDNSSKNVKVNDFQKTKPQDSDLISDILSSVKSKLAADIYEKKQKRKKKSSANIV